MMKQQNKKTIRTCRKCGKVLARKDMIRSKTEWRIKPLSKEQIEPAAIRIILGKGEKDRVTIRPKRMNNAAVEMLPLKISRRALQSFITELARKELGKEISFHTLRAGWATHLINSGRPMHEIQMLGGWSRLDTMGVYLRSNPQAAIQGARDVF